MGAPFIAALGCALVVDDDGHESKTVPVLNSRPALRLNSGPGPGPAPALVPEP